MNLERYPYINSNDYQDYEFYSDGPKGWIKKIVMFTKIPNSEPPIYNLGFGDQDQYSGETDDVVILLSFFEQLIFGTTIYRPQLHGLTLCRHGL